MSGAPIVKLDARPWPTATEAWKRGEVSWFEVAEEHWWYGLEVLPPIYFPGGFFMGEEADHDERNVPVFSAFVKARGRCFVRLVARDRIAGALVQLREALDAQAKPV